MVQPKFNGRDIVKSTSLTLLIWAAAVHEDHSVQARGAALQLNGIQVPILRSLEPLLGLRNPRSRPLTRPEIPCGSILDRSHVMSNSIA